MSFDYLRPVFIIFIVVLLIFLLVVILQNGELKLINGFSVICVSIICSLVSAINLWQIGIIADELGLGGDPVSFYMFLAIAGLSILNPIIYTLRK
ncbi:hypothetical protein [Brevibacillus daliensis]|uniref:hypothetical protein n=1 Tax=Brevibacillus daliensis TaxID=2892995 RepID=UPI001E434985|nr:hypothetical protein [Brevibacillus daliensis]